MRFLLPALTCLAVLCVTGAASAAPSAAERSLVKRVQAQEQSSIALLEQVVNINSGTMNFAGVRKVADVLQPRFAALGFKVRWEDGAAFGRAGHLIAEHPGPGRHVLLIGHFDTVFEPNHPFQRFERIDAQTAKGPGTSDMKGGLIVALAALTALKETKALDGMHITVVMMGDEEDAGQPITAARAALVEAAKSADVAIGLENGADDPKTALTARRGYTGWRIDVKARSAHSSQIFTDEVGAGAIYELSRILHTFYDELHGEELLTFNPGLIAGSTQLNFDQEKLHAETFGKDNIVAPVAVATGDLRTISNEQLERTKQRMQQIVAASLPGTSATIAFTDSGPPMPPTEGNRKLLAMYDAVSRDLGFGPVTAVDPRRAGAADISYVADHVEMAIDGIGLLGHGNHTPDEVADLRTFPIQSQRLAVLLLR
ncbi:MAG TPA: M20/M25/M40 family metallo-hydrolase, partial [Steroidobacteraceae bacterium]|nr:M20/M25/M40 family metallo-hydrolase [Steroidobacteraceae bacterium]